MNHKEHAELMLRKFRASTEYSDETNATLAKTHALLAVVDALEAKKPTSSASDKWMQPDGWRYRNTGATLPTEIDTVIEDASGRPWRLKAWPDDPSGAEPYWFNEEVGFRSAKELDDLVVRWRLVSPPRP